MIYIITPTWLTLYSLDNFNTFFFTASFTSGFGDEVTEILLHDMLFKSITEYTLIVIDMNRNVRSMTLTFGDLFWMSVRDLHVW